VGLVTFDRDALRDATILVTGGTGFIGRWLVETSPAARLLVLSRNPERFGYSHPSLSMVRGDLTALASLDERADFVIHGATEPASAIAANHPRLLLETIEGTRHALDYAQRVGARRFLYLSSGAVYGRQDVDRVPEDYRGAPDPLDARSAYGESKRMGELLCVGYDVETVIARGFAFIGPHLPLDKGFAAGNFLRDALAGRDVEVAGDGTPLRSYLYAEDLAAWLWTLLLRGRSRTAYNVGAEEEVSIAELAAEAAKLGGTKVIVRGKADPSKPPERYVPSTRRAREELGLDAWTDWRTALRRTFEWHRRQP
jgi:nucleoside-diphosphate-sugar epimerase